MLDLRLKYRVVRDGLTGRLSVRDDRMRCVATQRTNECKQAFVRRLNLEDLQRRADAAIDPDDLVRLLDRIEWLKSEPLHGRW